MDGFVCHTAGFGPLGKISLEIQDTLLEFQTPSVLTNHPVLTSNETRPNAVILQVGFMACYLPFNDSLHFQESLITDSEKKIQPLLTTIKQSILSSHSAISKPNSNVQTTALVISLAGRSLLSNDKANYCTWKLNRMIAYEAHKLNIPVLEREEIEHRLLFRSEPLADTVVTLKEINKIPGPQIVGASLISLLSCLETNITFSII